MPQFFSRGRLQGAIEHLQEFDSKWVLVPLVLASNGVGEADAVRIQDSDRAGSDRFFDRYFNGRLIGLADFDNGANTLRPRFREIWSSGQSDYVIHQRQKLWGNQYSRNGYNIMRDRGLLTDLGSSRWQIDSTFWSAWEQELPESFRFEELLVWLFAFDGLEDGISSWDQLSIAFQERHLGPGGRFPDGFERRFRTSDEISWPDEFLTERPSNEDFQSFLIPSLRGPEHDEEWLRARFEEWKTESGYPTDRDRHDLEMRERFVALLADKNLNDSAAFDLSLFRQILAQNYGGPGPQSHINRFLQQEGEPGVARLLAALQHLLYGSGEVAERIDDVTGDPDLQVTGLGEAIATKCLAIVDPARWIPLFVYRSAVGAGKQDILQVLDADLDDADTLSIGQAAVASNDRLRQFTEPLLPDDAWGQASFLWWLRQHGSDSGSLAKELLIDQQWIEDVGELLDDKLQVIFYGPPGTGKTFVAQRFAEWYADNGQVGLVQFHPSYAYEDFVQGYRPTDDAGQVRFEIRPGPFIEWAEKARTTGDVCVLVIDEINRGNIAKIFGELYYLLEYRQEEIQLQYGDAFELPKNLVLIGTMNTADRSIALLDAALRRRFHFVPFFPDDWPIEGLLGRWLTAHKPEMSYVADLLDRANGLLDDRDFQIGPAYFMTDKLDDRWLRTIWRYSIQPYLEEHFLDAPERLEDFDLDNLLSQIEADRDSGAGNADPGTEREGGESGEAEAPAS